MIIKTMTFPLLICALDRIYEIFVKVQHFTTFVLSSPMNATQTLKQLVKIVIMIFICHSQERMSGEGRG